LEKSRRLCSESLSSVHSLSQNDPITDPSTKKAGDAMASNALRSGRRASRLSQPLFFSTANKLTCQ
jgi:hypothetical protein